MNLKKIKAISIFGTFILSFICHFFYKWFPNVLTSIFFPVNESIFEHMKIIITSSLIYSIIEYYLIQKNDIKVNNYLLSLWISITIGIIFYLLIFVPIYLFFGENMIFTIILLFITYIIIQIISYYILNIKKSKYSNEIGLFLIVLTYIIFGYLTYNPPINFLFYDMANNIYGINTYPI